MKKQFRKLQKIRKKHKEGPFTYIVMLLDCAALALIIGGLFWLLSPPEPADDSVLSISNSLDQVPISPLSRNSIASKTMPIVSKSDVPRYSKVGGNGESLPRDASDWSCVFDSKYQRYWEVKTRDGGWRDAEHTYTWYRSGDTEAESGKPDGGMCLYIDCDTQAYLRQANLNALCGFSDWRLPSQKALQSLDHDSRYFPDIDIEYFPNTQSSQYWASSENPFSNSLAWSVDFSNGISYVSEKRLSYHVRLVREP